MAAVVGTAYLTSQSEENEREGYIPRTGGDDDNQGETIMRFDHVNDY